MPPVYEWPAGVSEEIINWILVHKIYKIEWFFVI